MSKLPPTQLRYTATNLTQFVFNQPQKTFIVSVRLLGKAVRMIREKQRELYGRDGSSWLERYFFELITTDKPLEELEHHIKKGY